MASITRPYSSKLPSYCSTVDRNALAARYAVPAMYHLRGFAADSGLMSYGVTALPAFTPAGFSKGESRLTCPCSSR
jgi:hypothetical protein